MSHLYRAGASIYKHQIYSQTSRVSTSQLARARIEPELAHLVRNVRRTARPGAHVGVRRQVPRGFPVFCCRGGRCGPAVTGAVQPLLPAAGLPIRLRPGPTRRRSSACAAARPGPPRGHGSRRSGLRRRSRAPSAAAASAGPTTRRGPSPRQWKQACTGGVSVARKKGAYRDRWRDRRRAAGVGVRAAAGALGPGSRNTPSLCSRWMFCCMFCRASAGVGASVPRPHATSP